MTPYAVLLCRPSDVDVTIRQTFYAISRRQHPDANNGVPGPQWMASLEAYNTIKTAERRERWLARMQTLSSLCQRCDGSGVVGSRLAGSKIRVCGTCHGEGRVK